MIRLLFRGICIYKSQLKIDKNFISTNKTHLFFWVVRRGGI